MEFWPVYISSTRGISTQEGVKKFNSVIKIQQLRRVTIQRKSIKYWPRIGIQLGVKILSYTGPLFCIWKNNLLFCRTALGKIWHKVRGLNPFSSEVIYLTSFRSSVTSNVVNIILTILTRTCMHLSLSFLFTHTIVFLVTLCQLFILFWTINMLILWHRLNVVKAALLVDICRQAVSNETTSTIFDHFISKLSKLLGQSKIEKVPRDIRRA